MKIKNIDNYEANFNLYLQKIWLDITDWLSEHTEYSESELINEINNNFFPIEIFLEYKSGNLFSSESSIIFANEKDCSFDIDFEDKTISVIIDLNFKLSCKSKFTENNYQKWESKTDRFTSIPALSFNIGEYEGDNGGSISPIFTDE